jgi:ribosomal protein L28
MYKCCITGVKTTTSREIIRSRETTRRQRNSHIKLFDSESLLQQIDYLELREQLFQQQ